jgi:hypothetical protein
MLSSNNKNLVSIMLMISLCMLGSLSILKGLTLIVDQTAAYLYYTDYRFGFVLRGMVGELFAPILSSIPLRMHHTLLIGWHISTLIVLLLALSWLAARTVAATLRIDVLAMAVLLFCAPLLTSLANFTAQPDVLLCCLTLGLTAALQKQRFLLAWAIFLIGVLVHQLMIFLALPIMILGSLLNSDRPLIALGSMLVGLAACLLVLFAPTPDERFISRFIEHGIPPHAARSLFEDQLSQGSARMLSAMAKLWRHNLLNGVIAVAYGALAGIIMIIGCLFSRDALGRVGGP